MAKPPQVTVTCRRAPRLDASRSRLLYRKEGATPTPLLGEGGMPTMSQVTVACCGALCPGGGYAHAFPPGGGHAHAFPPRGGNAHASPPVEGAMPTPSIHEEATPRLPLQEEACLRLHKQPLPAAACHLQGGGHAYA